MSDASAPPPEVPVAPGSDYSVADLEQQLDDAQFAAIEQAEWDDSDPERVSRDQPPVQWDDHTERQARDLAAQGKTEEAAELLKAAEAEAAPAEVEAPAETPAAPESEVEVAPAAPPAEDRIDRLAALVEKLVAPPEAPPAPEAKKFGPKDALALFDADANYRVHVLQQLGFTKPEHLEDPHAYRTGERYIKELIDAEEKAELRAEVESLRREREEERAQAAAQARDQATDAELAKAFANYGEIPAKTKTALAAAVKGAVARGSDAAKAIAVVFDTFGPVLPAKAPAVPAKPAPNPRQAQRDRALAATPRAATRTRNLTEELRRLEGGGGWS